MFRLCCLIWLGISAGLMQADEPRYELLVAGGLSDNVVAFDLETGADRVVAKLANGSQPRGLAASATGKIVVGLRGHERNLVQLVPRNSSRPQGVLVTHPLTAAIGRFGPGMVAFGPRGHALVACDTERCVRRVTPDSAEPTELLIAGRRANTFGVAVQGHTLFVTEYFQKSILSIDLNADPPVPRLLVDRSEHLDRPCGLTIGHNGHLFVSSLQNDFVQEFDPDNGQFLGTFLDVKSLGTARVHNLIYSDRIGHYFLSSGDVVFELDQDGSLLDRYTSPALRDAQGLACRPVPVK